MRTIAFLLTCMCLPGMMAGCYSDTKEAEAAKNLRQSVEDASRLYVMAASHIEPAIVPTEDGRASAQIEQTAVLDALKKAEQTLQQALADNADATAVGRAPAELMLAEVRRAQGDYYTRVARGRTQQFLNQMLIASGQLSAAESGAELAAVFKARAEADTGAITQLQQQAQQQLAELQAGQNELQTKESQLQARIGELSTQTAALREQASRLREQSRAAKAEDAIALYADAVQIEKQVSASEELIAGQQFELESARNALKQLAVQMQAVNDRLGALNERVTASAAQAAQAQENMQAQLAKVRSAMAEGLAGPASTINHALQQAVAAAESAMTAYAAAAQANKNALAGINQAQREASAAMSEDAESAVAIILDAMGNRNSGVAATAQKAQIELGQGDARRQLLGLIVEVQSFLQRVEKISQAVGAPVPAGFAEASRLIAAQKPVELKDAAYAAYEAAISAYDSARSLAAARPGRPELPNISATAWLYDAGKAAAQVAKYQLTGSAEDKAAAQATVTEILANNVGNPYLGPVQRLAQTLQAAN